VAAGPATAIPLLHEDMPTTRWIGFALVWVALVAFTIDLVRSSWAGRDEPSDELATTVT
jgi:chloramphenicol-sensitive protein RarD